MIVWYAYNWVVTGRSHRPNLFSSKEKAKEWVKKDSKYTHGKYVPDNYIIDIEEVK